MTCPKENTQFNLAMGLLIANGFEGLAGSISILLNTKVAPLSKQNL